MLVAALSPNIPNAAGGELEATLWGSWFAVAHFRIAKLFPAAIKVELTFHPA